MLITLRVAFGLVAFAVTAGCGTSVVQTTACKDYIACYLKTGGTEEVVDKSFGPMGSCWGNAITADSCEKACTRANDDYTASGAAEDAGCTFN